MQNNQQVTKLDVATWGGFFIFAVSATIVAVSLPEISASFNTSLSEGGGMESVRSLLVLVVLFLAGFLAQRWGKKRFLSLGQYLLAAGFLLASLAPNYPALLLALMLMGIGGGFSEALLNPLIVDIHDRDAGRFLNISHAFYPVGIMTSAIIFGELLTLGFSWRLLFQFAALAALLIALAFSLLPYPPAPKDDTPYSKIFGRIFSLGGFWLFAAAIILAGAIESALSFWSRTYVGQYHSSVPRAGAIALGLFAAAMIFGRLLTAYLTRKANLNLIMITAALLGLVVAILIPRATTLPGFYTLLTLAGLAIAPFWPTILAEADDLLRVNTTILFVMLSGFGMIGYGFTPLALGIIGDQAGLRSGFSLIPLLYILLLLVLLADRRLRAKTPAPTLAEDMSTD